MQDVSFADFGPDSLTPADLSQLKIQNLPLQHFASRNSEIEIRSIRPVASIT